VRRLQGALGIKPMGNSRHHSYLLHVYNAMAAHYKGKQEEIYEAVRKFYAQHTCNVHDARGILIIDISYDGTLEATPPEWNWVSLSKS
ncbi:hypothetical protein SK128_028287, partial [Halocaridina rubra]